MERYVAVNMRIFKNGFKTGILDDNWIQNAEETHLEFNIDKEKTFAFLGDQYMNYKIVVPGGDHIKIDFAPYR